VQLIIHEANHSFLEITRLADTNNQDRNSSGEKTLKKNRKPKHN